MMKIDYRVAALIVLLTVSASAQKVSPSSVNFGDVLVGQTSPQKNVSFTNIGNSDLQITVSITGPFAIPVNSCGRGVKVETHCNVGVTYTPEAIETDTGTLSFNYGEATVSIPLTGTGVTTLSYATKTKLVGPKGTLDLGQGWISLTFTAAVTSKGGDLENYQDEGNAIIWCDGTIYGINPVTVPVYGGVATLNATVAQVGRYTCTAQYQGIQAGDIVFQPSTSNVIHFTVVDECCAAKPSEKRRED